jgi:hypothetical protein
MSRTIIFLTVITLLALPVLGSDDNQVSFKLFANESGDLNLNIRLNWETDPTIAAFSVYSVPSNTQLWYSINPDIDSSTFQQLNSLNSYAMSVGNRNAAVQLDVSQIEDDTGYVFSKLLVNELTEVILLNLQYGDYTGHFDFEAKFSNEPDATGCFTAGRCGDGSWITGPYCDPCFFRLCCVSSPPFIDCDHLVICP